MQLTPEQMVDILFQRDNRITKGVLERRSFAEKARDAVFNLQGEYWNKSSGSLAGIRSSLVLEFEKYANCPVNEEHPRSHRKAMLELKALGFSTAQVNQISRIMYRTIWFSAFYDMSRAPGGYGYEICQNHPGLVVGFNSRAFLGVCAFRHPGNKATFRPVNNLTNSRTEQLTYDFYLKVLENKDHYGISLNPQAPRPGYF